MSRILRTRIVDHSGVVCLRDRLLPGSSCIRALSMQLFRRQTATRRCVEFAQNECAEGSVGSCKVNGTSENRIVS